MADFEDQPRLPMVTTGGIVDPSLGEARIFKTTVVDEVDENPSPGFQRKHVSRIVEQTAVLGTDIENMETKALPPSRLMAAGQVRQPSQRKPWEEQEQSPLYSSQVRKSLCSIVFVRVWVLLQCTIVLNTPFEIYGAKHFNYE